MNTPLFQAVPEWQYKHFFKNLRLSSTFRSQNIKNLQNLLKRIFQLVLCIFLSAFVCPEAYLRFGTKMLDFLQIHPQAVTSKTLSIQTLPSVHRVRLTQMHFLESSLKINCFELATESMTIMTVLMKAKTLVIKTLIFDLLFFYIRHTHDKNISMYSWPDSICKLPTMITS